MKIIDGKEHQSILIEMMSILDNVARDNNINYSLGGGTLLGAVRHQGFIPWDDDLDIMLLRDEYEQFVKCIKGQTDLIVMDPEDDLSLSYNFVKVVYPGTFVKSINKERNDMGVYIDVFPIDGLPVGEEDQYLSQMKSLERQVQRSSFKYFNSATNRRKKIAKSFLLFGQVLLNKRFGPYISQHEKILNTMSTYRVSSSNNVAYLFTFYNEQYPKEIFDNYIDLNFEDKQFMVISDYDLYLKNLYGDYMKLPPKNKRITHSFYSFYRKG
ncbi:LicD family protein [Weissella koreensis]|uniref:LicD family protein n=1 Tax=Weissella koreensis TaxID=165096 RepID=UPI0022BA4421|nr:LicD family protein [Weissella koreensis]MCZ9310876.1 LicD family protein [Weissella koreensis]